MADISVYYDNGVCHWHLDELRLPNCKKFSTVTDYLTDTTATKIAILHIPFPLDLVDRQSFESRFQLLFNISTRVIVLVSELHNEIVDFILSNIHPKIRYFTCGMVNNVPDNHWLDWFITTCAVYKHNPSILTQLTPYKPKPKFFDVLLGQPKPHRDFVYNNVINKHDDKVVMTYLTDFTKTLQENDESGWIWELPGLELPQEKFKWTVTMVSYYGLDISLSQVIPFSIYNQTAYSIVAETNFHNHYTFFTEKTVKPLLAKRLFIMFAGQHHLKKLHSLGFKTFDGIIDESYDEIEEQTERFTAAFAQMEYLFAQPQEEILEKIKPITEHNYNVVMSDWLGSFHQKLKSFLVDGL